MKLDPLSLGMTLGLIVVKLVNLIQEKGSMPSIAYLNILVISLLFLCQYNCFVWVFQGRGVCASNALMGQNGNNSFQEERTFNSSLADRCLRYLCNAPGGIDA